MLPKLEEAIDSYDPATVVAKPKHHNIKKNEANVKSLEVDRTIERGHFKMPLTRMRMDENGAKDETVVSLLPYK